MKVVLKKDKNKIKSLIFITNKGTHSPLFGAEGGNETEEYRIKPGDRFIGIFGNIKKDEESFPTGIGFFIGENFSITTTKTEAYGNNLIGKYFEWTAGNKEGKLSRI